MGTPGAGNTITISSGHTVTIGNNLSYTGDPMVVHVHGTWRFNGGGARVTLPSGSAVIIHEGGSVTSVAPGNGGSSQRIIIGSTTHWQGGPGSTVNGPWSWPEGALPVELVAFLAERQPGGVLLRWTTASEMNSAHFDVHRSHDGRSWDRVASLDAAGQSQQAVDHSFFDTGVTHGTWYFALSQTDLDGTVQELGVVAVALGDGPSVLRCAVDEADPQRIRLWLPAVEVPSAPYSLVDLSRGSVQGLGVAASHGGIVQLWLPPLSPGVYMVRMDVEGAAMGCRFTIAR